MFKMNVTFATYMDKMLRVQLLLRVHSRSLDKVAEDIPIFNRWPQRHVVNELIDGIWVIFFSQAHKRKFLRYLERDVASKDSKHSLILSTTNRYTCDSFSLLTASLPGAQDGLSVEVGQL
jgi:hypothetical protein